jgi:V8-like Glu-specific endopeptidase
MNTIMKVALACSTLIASNHIGMAFAGDAVEDNAGATRLVSDADMNKAKAMENALPAPDTSTAVVDTSAGTDDKGAMGKNGRAARNGRAFGSFGIPYTTTRVQDGAQSAGGTSNASRMSTTYPYRAAGKLTFVTLSGGNSFCTASVIRRGIIVTAAHCISPFGSAARYTTFRFRPGHYGPAGATAAQIAPHGTWEWKALVRPGSWTNGTDTGCGSARNNDLAVIALKKNSSGQFIGDVTGQFGYGWNNYSFVTSPKTGNLHTAAISALGYPALMDSGSIMQRSDGPSYTINLCDGTTEQLWQGSNFTGGSSGGPWVVNMRTRKATLSGGAVEGSAPVMAVVGVTSWGSADPNTPKDNYSSQFGQNAQYPNADYGGRGAGNIGSLLNTLCSAIVSGTNQTYAQQGYCS